MEGDNFKLYQGDCLEILKVIPNETIDVILTSPPYNLGNNHHTNKKKTQAYSDSMDEEEYQIWQINVLQECFRVLKKTGSLLYNHKNRIKDGLQITPYEWLFKTSFLFKQELVWINGSPNFDKIRFYPFTERIYWMVKDKKTILDNVINSHDVFKWSAEGSNLKHSRTFPKKMALDLLECFPDSKVILDPFMGSGTVGVVSKILKKHFIGIEKNEEFFTYAQDRIKNNFPETDKNKILKVKTLF